MFLSGDGAPGFKCFRARCADNHWKQLCMLLGEKGGRPASEDHPGTKEIDPVMEWLDERFTQIINRDLVAENKTGILRSHNAFIENRLSDVLVDVERDDGGTIKVLAGRFWLKFHSSRPKCHDVGLFPGQPRIVQDGDYFNLWIPREPLPLDDASVDHYIEPYSRSNSEELRRGESGRLTGRHLDTDTTALRADDE